MKNTFLIVINLLLLFGSVSAQEQTLLGDGEITSGWLAGASARYTKVNEQAGVILGARGGWVINHSFVVGGGMYGLVGNATMDIIDGDIIYKDAGSLRFAYGGLELEYILAPMSVVHITFYALLGAGGLGEGNYEPNNDENDYYHGGHNFMRAAVFVAEPAINLEINVAKFFRIDLGAAYRFVSGNGYQTVTGEKLSAPSASLTLKFGDF